MNQKWKMSLLKAFASWFVWSCSVQWRKKHFLLIALWKGAHNNFKTLIIILTVLLRFFNVILMKPNPEELHEGQENRPRVVYALRSESLHKGLPLPAGYPMMLCGSRQSSIALVMFNEFLSIMTENTQHFLKALNWSKERKVTPYKVKYKLSPPLIMKLILNMTVNIICHCWALSACLWVTI